MESYQNKTPSPMTPPPVLFGVESVGALGHSTIGLATIELDRPAVLNALDTNCYKLIEERLVKWQDDANIGAVVISGKGGKAFCAGGDVKGLIIKSKEFGLEIAFEFFTNEYFVDGLIHKYKKPVIAICDGITMGGGLGLAAGAVLRIATERTVVAMPELSIGFFPDVGATCFLRGLTSRPVRPPFGLFMGLTGARLSGADALRMGLMDAFVPSNRLRHFHADLLRTVAGATEPVQLQSNLANLKSALIRNEPPEGGMNKTDEHIIEDVFSLNNLSEIDRSFKKARGLSPWLEETRTRYLKGSPLSRAVFFAAFERHRELSIIKTLAREWDISINFSKSGEFTEGVRAVLIDKDQSPKWRYAELTQVPQEAVAAMFSPGEQMNKSPGSENRLEKKFRQFGL